MKPKNLITYLLVHLLLLIAGILLATRHANAQAKISLQGIVADSTTQKPLDFVTVNLKNGKNVALKVLLTKTDGSFTFTGLEAQKYTLTISTIGYQSKTISVDMADGKSHNVGTLSLSTQSKQLNSVAVTADKPIVKQEVDRISYDLQADPESKVNSVLEMLRKVPFVTLDADDNILLKGNSSYKILINGKPSSMVERDPKNILRSMPASTIQRIEVITIPPAKYDAEGLAGIINIITNKKVDNGYNGTLNINDRYTGGPGLGSSFAIKQGKWGFDGYAGGSIYDSPQTSSLNTRATTGVTPTNLVQQGYGTSNGRSGYLGTELSYEIDSLNLISGQFNINGNRGNGNNAQASLLTGAAGILQGYDLTNLSYNNGKGNDASLNYQLGFKANKSQLLTFSYRYYQYSNFSNNGISTTDRVNYTTPDYNQDNNTHSSEQTVQVDYVQPLKKVNVEAGVKGIFRSAQSDFEYNSYNTISNLFINDPTLSNSFNDTQDIFAAYNTWQYAGKGWGIKGGVRIEETITDANFISTSSIVHQNYFNVIPSVAINKDFKDRSGINIGFTQRIKRPGINRLNPFVDRSNPDFQSSGNPNLSPVLINDIQVSYHFTKKAQVNIALSYDFAKNLDLQVSTFDPATNITTTTYQNQGKAKGALTNVNVNYPITKKLNFSLNGGLAYFWLSGIVNGVMQNTDFLTENLSASAGYLFDKGWRVNANLNANGRNPTGFQGSSNGVISSAFSINKEVVKNKLTLAASVNNPFTKYRNSILETTGTGFTQTMVNQSYFRSFRVSLNYNFGKLKGDIKKAKRGINNDDVSK